MSNDTSPKLVVRNTFLDVVGSCPFGLQRSTSAPGRITHGGSESEPPAPDVAEVLHRNLSEQRSGELVTNTATTPTATETVPQAPVEATLLHTTVEQPSSSSTTARSPAPGPELQTMLPGISGGEEQADSEVAAQVSAEKLRQHEEGVCKPCAYFHAKTDGCRLAEACSFCHLCSIDEVKIRKSAIKRESRRKPGANNRLNKPKRFPRTRDQNQEED